MQKYGAVVNNSKLEFFCNLDDAKKAHASLKRFHSYGEIIIEHEDGYGYYLQFGDQSFDTEGCIGFDLKKYFERYKT